MFMLNLSVTLLSNEIRLVIVHANVYISLSNEIKRLVNGHELRAAQMYSKNI